MSGGRFNFNFDFEALSSWIAVGTPSAGPISRREFGAHAVPRLLCRIDEVPRPRGIV